MSVCRNNLKPFNVKSRQEVSAAHPTAGVLANDKLGFHWPFFFLFERLDKECDVLGLASMPMTSLYISENPAEARIYLLRGKTFHQWNRFVHLWFGWGLPANAMCIILIKSGCSCTHDLEVVRERPSSRPKNTKARLEWNGDQWLWSRSTHNKTCSRRCKLHWIIFSIGQESDRPLHKRADLADLWEKLSGWLSAGNYTLELGQGVLSLLGIRERKFT